MPGIDDLVPYEFKRSFSPSNFFTRLISEGKIKFNLGVVSIDLKDNDAQRVHDIVFSIDDHRAFYDPIADEEPDTVIQSVYETKQDIYKIAQGLWANIWSEKVVRSILHDIGDFQTKVGRTPLPSHSDKAGFERFEQQLLELRLKVWTGVAHYVIVYGEAAPASHMPPEILIKTQKAYNLS